MTRLRLFSTLASPIVQQVLEDYDHSGEEEEAPSTSPNQDISQLFTRCCGCSFSLIFAQCASPQFLDATDV